MSGLILDHNPITRSASKYYEEDGAAIIQNVQDIQPVLEYNQAIRNMTDERARWTRRGGDDFGVGAKIASIPSVVWYSLPREIREDNNKLLRWLDERDQEPFRVRPGRLSR